MTPSALLGSQSQVHLGGKIWGHQVQKIPLSYYMFLVVYFFFCEINILYMTGLFVIVVDVWMTCRPCQAQISTLFFRKSCCVFFGVCVSFYLPPSYLLQKVLTETKQFILGGLIIIIILSNTYSFCNSFSNCFYDYALNKHT